MYYKIKLLSKILIIILLPSSLFGAYYDENGDLYTRSIRGDVSDQDILDQPQIYVFGAENRLSFLVIPYGGNIPINTDRYGYYDYEPNSTFNLTSGTSFSENDINNVIYFISGDYQGYAFRIASYVDANTVEVEAYGADSDIGSIVSPLNFYTYNPPTFAVGDNKKVVTHTGSDGAFQIWSDDFSNDFVFSLISDVATDNTYSQYIHTIANGYSGTLGFRSEMDCGALSSGESAVAISGNIDIDGTGSDSLAAAFTSSVSGNTTGSATSTAFVVLPGFDYSVYVVGAEPESADYNYEVASGVVTDRSTEFTSTASNVQIFDSVNDYILIGDSATFEGLFVSLATNANISIVWTIEYSTGTGTWGTLTIDTDTTTQFQSSGQIYFNAPVDWAMTDQAESASDISSGYYIKITRTRVGLLTPPAENIFRIISNLDSSFTIDGKGFINPKTSADTIAPNNSIYYSTNSGALVYKDATGTVNDLY